MTSVLEPDVYVRQREYWRSRGVGRGAMRGLLDELSAGTDADGAESLGHEALALSAAASANVIRVCGGSDLSLYIVLVALFKCAAARYADDPLTAVLSLPYAPDDNGLRDRLLVLQDRVDLDAPVRSAIESVRRTVLGAYSNQDFPLEELHGADELARLRQDSPLLLLQGIHHADPGPDCPLVIGFSHEAGTITGTARYHATRLRADLVKQLCVNYVAFVEYAASDYSQRVRDVTFLTAPAEDEIRARARGAERLRPAASLDGLIAEQARRTPDDVAVICGDDATTYRDLDRMACRGAARLRDAGCEGGDLVAVRLRPGIESIAALLGALRAGAAFVPIGVDEPPARVRTILDRCAASVLVSDSDGPGPVLRVEAMLDGWQDADEPAPRTSDPTQLAYVLHTSGSTGQPNAVAVEHRGIVNSVAWKAGEYGFARGDRVLPLFGCTFDGFILNALAPLVAGAAVVLMPEGHVHDPRAIAQTIEQYGVTHVAAAPIVYGAVLRAARPEQLASVRRITLAGDVASRAAVGGPPGAVVSNEYGPTETSVVATWQRELAADACAVVGRPIDNTCVYVLDGDRRLLPIGMTGEVYIGGAGLARGYLGDAELTERAFVTWRGERLYRTGDRARWLPDGRLEFRGREEHRRKIRGVRVDLEAVRATLLEHPRVDVAILAVAGPDDSPCLCAAVVGQAGGPELQEHLRERLPPGLVPQAVVTLPQIPLAEGGKPDMEALAAVFRHALGVEAAEPPQTDVERELVDVWKDVLELDEVGVNQSFFALGGHSLTATVVLAEIYDQFGVELALDVIFKRQTVRELAATVADAATGRSPAAPVEAAREDVLSPAQERMVGLALSQPPNMAYNIPILFELEGSLDEERLRRALARVVGRHESLRTSFHLDGGQYVREVANVDDIAMVKHHLKDHHRVWDEARAALAPFDLTRPPLLAVTMFIVGDERRYLLFDFHHSVVDEASLPVIFDDLSRVYARAELPEPGAPYQQFTAWQLQQKAAPDYQDRLARWRGALEARHIEPLRLPYDRDAPSRRTFEGDVVRADLSPAVLARVDDLCRAHEVTPFVFVLATLAVLLHRYTSQGDIVIGAPVSQRKPAFHRAVGFFLNPVPFAIAVDPTLPFGDLLERVKVSAADDVANAVVQFEDLLRELRLERRYGENPLFNVAIAFRQGDAPLLSLDGLRATPVNLHNGTSKYDLTFEVDLAGADAHVAIEYATERFHRDTAVRMMANLSALIEDVSSRPGARVRDLGVLSSDGDAILGWGCSTSSATDDEQTLASLFERQAAARQSEVALVLGDRSVTYGDLNAESNRLARRLGSVVSPGDFVAVACGRSIATVVAMLAVQKAGAAHLPVDPRTPVARAEQMLDDSGAAALIVDGDRGPWAGFGGPVIDLEAEDLSGFPALDAPPASGPDDGAYVLYTSGTTGKPNGVLVPQRSIVRLVREAGAHFDISPSDVWTLFHSLNFDVSVWEIFGSLLHGSKLVIVPESVAVDARRFLALLHGQRVTVLCQPPSAFYLLADEMLRAAVQSTVRAVILGGEAIKLRRLGEWYAAYPAIGLYNGYGTTETAIYSTFKRFGDHDVRGGVAYLGRPVGGTNVYVLDQDRAPCPIGVVGEIHIGGAGVSGGYLGRRELTARRFVPDPFEPGRTMYRTGDLGRWLPSGELEYLSRVDHQVKVRGHRVELGDVEQHMVAIPAVRDAVVTAEEDPQVGTRLIGHFTSTSDIDTAAIRRHLETQLPPYMVPAIFVRIPKVPVTPNGKVDRAALPSPREAMERGEGDSVAPVEDVLREAWANVLGVAADSISATDSFFDIGGDSIGANLVVSILSARGLELEVVDIFVQPTIEGLSELLHTRQENGATAGGGDAPSPTGVYVDLPAMELRSLAGDDETRDLEGAVLTALGMALRMVTGVSTFTIAVERGAAAGGHARPGRFTLRIADINDDLTNFAAATAGLRQAFAETGADGNGSPADGMAATFTSADDGRTFARIAWRTSRTSLVLEPADRDGHALALDVVAENLRFALRQILAALEEVRPRKAVVEPRAPWVPPHLRHDVRPYNDVPLVDCAHQALAAAMSSFGRDATHLAANFCATYELDDEHPAGVGVCHSHVAAMPVEDLLRRFGVGVEAGSADADVCDSIVSRLAAGDLAIVKVDCFHLEGRGYFFGRRHAPTSLLVFGYDLDKRRFDIVENDSVETGLYGTASIGFDDLRDAYSAYCTLFDPARSGAALLIASKLAGEIVPPDDQSRVRLALDAMRIADTRAHESLTAIDRLEANLPRILMDSEECLRSLPQVHFLVTDILQGRRLEAFRLRVALRDRVLGRLVAGTVEHLEFVANVLTKAKLSGTWPEGSVASLAAKIETVADRERRYVEMRRRLVQGPHA